MPQILPATIENLKLSSKIICDTNILISYFDINSEFNSTIKSTLNGIADEDCEIEFLYTLISYLEGIEFMRRKTLTVVFNSTLGIVPISKRSRSLELYRKFSQYNSENEIPYFLDHQIKKIREAIIKASANGHEEWKKMLTLQAKQGFLSNFYQFNTLKAFTFAKPNESTEYPADNLKAWITWHKVEDIIRSHGTSHLDSAILSLTKVAN